MSSPASKSRMTLRQRVTALRILPLLLLSVSSAILWSSCAGRNTPAVSSSSTVAFSLEAATPNRFAQNQTTTIIIRGAGIGSDTEFFLEAVKLEVVSRSAEQVSLIVPAGFPAATYGVMAVNPNGTRAALYPAFTLETSLIPPQNPLTYAQSFAEGYVIDARTGQPLAGAKVRVGGLSAVSTSTGHYLLRGLPQGRQAIRIEAPGYEPTYRIAEVSGEAGSLTLKLAALEPADPNVTSIGSAGGTHRAGNGAFLVVPPGALDADTPIRLTHLRSAASTPQLPQDGNYLGFAHLEPSGLLFKKPATLFLPLPAGVQLKLGTTIRITYFDEREGRWVPEITSGTISARDGKQYLEYELNHFSFGGGSFQPDPVTGCVNNADSSPAVGITTNWGVTDETGRFQGTATQSEIGRDLTLRAFGPSGTSILPRTVLYDGSKPVDFGACLTLTSTPSLFIVPPRANDSDVFDNPPRIFQQSVKGELSAQTDSSTSQRTLLAARGVYNIVSEIPNYSALNVDPTKIKISIGGRDLTGKAKFTYPARAGEDSLAVAVTLEEPPRTGSSVEMSVSVETQSGQKASAKSVADVVGGFTAPSVYPIIVPDDTPLPVESGVFTTEGKAGLVAVIRRRDAPSNYFTVNVPIRAVDANGKRMLINSTDTVGFGWEGGSGRKPLVNGEALVPLNVYVDGTNTRTYDHIVISPPDFATASLSSSSVARAGTGGRPGCPVSNDGYPGPCIPEWNVPLEQPMTVFDRLYSVPVIKGVTDWIYGINQTPLCFNQFCFTLGDASTIGWSMAPFAGDLSTLAQEAVSALMGKGFDSVAGTLAGISLAADAGVVTGGLGALGSGLVGIYKISKDAGSGTIAKFITNVLTRVDASVGGVLKHPEAALEALKNELDFLWDIFKEGGDALKNAERNIDKIKEGPNLLARNPGASADDLANLAVKDFEAYRGVSKAASTTPDWTSPGGIKYGENNGQTRLDHLLQHLTIRPGKTTFTGTAEGLLADVDNWWAQIAKNPDQYFDTKLFAYVFPTGRIIGTKGETTVRIVMDTSGVPPKIITAYPQ